MRLFPVRLCAVLLASLAVSCDRAAPPPQAATEEPWIDLFPASGWGDWERVEFAGGGEVTLDHGVLVMEQGAELTGVFWQGELPTVPYEMELKGRRVLGSDFFCGLTAPVAGGDRSVTLILGGWGGGVVGISSIDGHDASENETTNYLNFEYGRWYHLRLVVQADRLAAWIDGEKVVDVAVAGRDLGLRPGDIEGCAPLGLATWQTAGEISDFRWRNLPE